MHVPPSSGASGESPGTHGEPEILTGPADEPKRAGRSRRSARRSGPAVAVFSVLAVALLGGGAAFALMNRAEDGGPQGRSPETAQQASQDPARPPGDDPARAQDPSGPAGPDAEDAGGAGDAGTAAGQDDTSAGSGGGSGPSEPESGSGPDSAAGSPSRDTPGESKPTRRPQSGPASPPATGDDPLSDGDTGYVHPQGPVGGY